jgi:hypothetical protein
VQNEKLEEKSGALEATRQKVLQLESALGAHDREQSDATKREEAFVSAIDLETTFNTNMNRNEISMRCDNSAPRLCRSETGLSPESGRSKRGFVSGRRI